MEIFLSQTMVTIKQDSRENLLKLATSTHHAPSLLQEVWEASRGDATDEDEPAEPTISQEQLKKGMSYGKVFLQIRSMKWDKKIIEQSCSGEKQKQQWTGVNWHGTADKAACHWWVQPRTLHSLLGQCQTLPTMEPPLLLHLTLLTVLGAGELRALVLTLDSSHNGHTGMPAGWLSHTQHRLWTTTRYLRWRMVYFLDEVSSWKDFWGPRYHQRQSWCPWSMQLPETMFMSVFCAATIEHVGVHSPRHHQKPYWCPWCILLLKAVCLWSVLPLQPYWHPQSQLPSETTLKSRILLLLVAMGKNASLQLYGWLQAHDLE